jgi:hypothetical protein
MESLVFQLLIFAVLFSVGFGFGRYNERKHLAELEQNEKRLAYITVGNLRKVSFEQSGHMISSNVVISHDYFKYVLATVQNFFGVDSPAMKVLSIVPVVKPSSDSNLKRKSTAQRILLVCDWRPQKWACKAVWSKSLLMGLPFKILKQRLLTNHPFTKLKQHERSK